MTAVMRFLFALLLGVLIGAGATVYLIQSDAGNLLVRRTEVVQDLQRRLAGVEQQRDQLNRQLEDVIARASRMEQAFTDLERRFRTLGEEKAPPAGPAAPPAAAAP
jgi:chromosome condensin MukBEF ATPase and DNA-binding subunit MukB